MYLSTTVQLCYTIMLTDNTTTHRGVKSTCCDILESVISIILYIYKKKSNLSKWHELSKTSDQLSGNNTNNTKSFWRNLK